MKYHILAAVPFQKAQRRYLEQTGSEECRFVFYPELCRNWPKNMNEAKARGEGLAEDLLRAEIIIGEPPLSLVRELTEREDRHLQWVQMTWAGTDIYTAPQRLAEGGLPDGIRLTNMSGAFGHIIAEYVMGAVLYFYRNIPTYHAQQQERLWKDIGTEDTLEGKRVLILGTGDLGVETARKMKAFDAYVVGFRRNVVDKPAYFDEICGQDSWKEQLAQADVVVGCLPNNAATTGMMGLEEFRAMKSSAIFVNVGRGTLVKTKELEQVLSEGHLRGVALDVTDPEPLPKESTLWQRENVLITPHIAGPSFGHSPKTEERIVKICGENLQRFLRGGPLYNEQNTK